MTTQNDAPYTNRTRNDWNAPIVDARPSYKAAQQRAETLTAAAETLRTAGQTYAQAASMLNELQTALTAGALHAAVRHAIKHGQNEMTICKLAAALTLVDAADAMRAHGFGQLACDAGKTERNGKPMLDLDDAPAMSTSERVKIISELACNVGG